MSELSPGEIRRSDEHRSETAESAEQRNEHAKLDIKREQAEQQHKLEASREQIDKMARSKEELKHSEKPEESDSNHYQTLVTSDLRNTVYKRTTTRLRKRLTPPERIFDRIMQQPAVDAVSEFASKTVARPWPLLLGGLFATVGYAVSLFYAKQYGYPVKPSVYLVLFLIGYGSGLALEAIVKYTSRSKR